MGLMTWLSELFYTNKAPVKTTEKKDHLISKELLNEVLDMESSIVLFFSKEGGWIGANKSFYDTFGFEDIDAFTRTHESIRELFSEESEEVFTEYDRSWLDYVRLYGKNGYTVKIVDKANKSRLFRAKCRQVGNSKGDLYILELEDISELEDALRKSEEIDKIKSKFLSNIGHEFRTPMNGILGFVELLEKSDLSERQSEHIQMIHTSARNLMSNIESLLDLAQMQSGRLSVSESEFNMIAELEELARFFIYDARQKGLNATFFIDPKIPTYITGDAGKVKQVLNNLVSNAIKFTKKGGRVWVELKLLKRAQNGACSIGFSIKDTGKGISKEQLGNITQPFVSGEHPDGRLGVGLSLSYGLISILGGELKIQSEEGRGSNFSFSLPFAGSSDESLRLVPDKTVKVVLLDEKKIDDAHLLTAYLRAFGLNVVKVHILDEEIYAKADMLYLIASQEHDEWFMRLNTYQKRCGVVMLLDEKEHLQTRYTRLVDYSLNKPLLPSNIGLHLSRSFKLPKEKKPIENLEKSAVRALVVEDNLINQRLIKILLQEYRIEVMLASNGEEAVQLCEVEDFDIVFMDIDMPVKDGIMATQEIKERERPGRIGYMPIIALTALAMQGDREHILDEGLDDYLSKPLTREKLEYILTKHLKLKV